MISTVLWFVFMSETREKIHNISFQVKISGWNVILSFDIYWVTKIYNAYFSKEYGKILREIYLPINENKSRD